MADNLTTELNKLSNEFKNAIERNDTAATERLNDAISALEAKMKAVELAASRNSVANDAETTREAEYKTAFDSYLRGDKDALNEFKAMTAGTSSQGGYTVPKVIYNQIQKLIVDISPIRSVARVLQADTTDFHLPVSTGGTASGWVGETDSRTNTNTSVFTEVVPTFGELYAKPVVTQTLIEDSQFDIQAFVAAEVAIEFARAEGAAFLNGTGTKQPTGLLTPTLAATADSARAFGTVQYLASGAAANFIAPTASASPADVLIAMTMAVKAGYRANSRFIMNKATLGVVRSFKDAYGRFIWEPSLAAGQPSTLLGYEVIEAEDMPSIAAGSTPILFGDFNRAYTIADRVGMSMMVDPYTQAPYVVYNARKRLGGNVVDTQAYKVLKIAAS